MAKDSSFDITCEPNLMEVDNALGQLEKELATRFDFKGSEAKVLREELVLKLNAESEMRMKNLRGMLEEKFIKRGVALQFLDYGKEEDSLGGNRKQDITIRKGIPIDKAKEIVRFIKDKKFKVNPAIQAETIRVSSPSKDALQQVIVAVKGHGFSLPLTFGNYR